MEATNTTKRKLPLGWRWVRLGEVCYLVNGDAYRDSDWSREGVPIVRIQNLNDPSKSFNYWAGSLEDRVRIKTGDVLLAWSGTPGTSFGAHLWTRGDAVLNQHIFRVDLEVSTVVSQWAVFAINWQLEAMIAKAHGGVGLRHVTKREVESLQVLLPPSQEQKRIATILNEQMATVEQARAAAQAQLDVAKALPNAYLSQIFPKPGRDLPKGWLWARFLDVADLLPSKSIASDGDAEVQAVTTACLTETGFNPCGIKTARMWLGNVAECTLGAGEILIARSNTPELVGRVAMFPGFDVSVVASDLTIRARTGERLLPEFATAYLSAIFASGYWRTHAGGASGSMKKLTRTQIQELRVPIPPLPEQKRIATALNEKMKEAEQLSKSLEAQLDEINTLPASLLCRAFAGEL